MDLMREAESTNISLTNELFEEISLRYSTSIAIKDHIKSISYEDLNENANSLAYNLMNTYDLKNNQVVAILNDRSIETIIAMLAILKSGGVFLPIDPSLPINRIKYMINDSMAKFIVTSHKHQQIYDELISKIILLDDVANLPKVEEKIKVTTSSSDPAYIIYTSGSTGTPKGVLIKHEGLCNLKSVFTNDLYIYRTDKILQFASISFDASVWEIFMALFIGASLFIVPQNIIMNPKHFETYLNTNEITVVTLGPTYLSYLDPTKVGNLRLVITAGSQISSELAKKWSDFEYVNAYGPTETTICATIWKSLKSHQYDSIPIGKPIQNCSVFVMDENHNEVPPGQSGELCIGGVNLAIGYLNNEEMTKKKFIFNNHLNMYLYKTGDHAKILDDGNLLYLGRIDDQIKIRGYRIEIGEIEHYLKTYPDILDACVKVIQNPQNQDQLCAYYLSEAEINSLQLKEFLNQFLPSYMIPNHVVRLDKFPLTVSGKTNKSLLPSPYSL